VRASGVPLPMEQIETYMGLRSTVVFSRWNEPITLETPKGAVLFLSDWREGSEGTGDAP
jgi:hypothetical protein